MSDGRPLVSVVTISFKDLEGLRRTRQSVEMQSATTQIQHIIVDGGSGPEVESYLASLDPGVVWISERDQGRYDAMNKGVSLATGQYVWFMNSGDRFAGPSSVERAVSYLTGPHSWGFGYARFRDADDRFLGSFGHLPFRMDRFALGGQAIPHQAAVFGSEVISDVGPYDLSHGTAADQLFMMRCARRVAPIAIPEFLADFDIGGVGSSRRLWHYYRDMSRARKKAGVVVLGSSAADLAATTLLYVVAAVRIRIERLVRGYSGHHA